MLAVINQRFHKYLRRYHLKKTSNPSLSEYYFGYGANLDTSRFTKNFMHVEEVGIATLRDHELLFTLATEYKNKSYAGVHIKQNSNVPGVLVKMDLASLKYLDALEWCGFGAYDRVKHEVEINGTTIMAWVYIVKFPDFSRIPSKLYLSNMLKTAKLRSFPEDYIQYLELHPSQEKFEIDHGFSLWSYRSTRPLKNIFKLFYKFHDRIREKICELI